MRNHVRVSAKGVLASGAVALLGGILAATTAFAVPAAPTNIVINSDGNVIDNYINAAEQGAVVVTGSFVAPVIAVKVEIVNSASCFAGAAQHAPANGQYTLATITGTTFSATFDVTHFDEGAVLCARARASADGINYGPNGNSTILPVKDAVVIAGTVVMNDPNADGFLNLAEENGATVSANWTAANPDATSADVWYGPDGSASNYAHADCGEAPALLADYTSPASGNLILTTLCSQAIADGQVFSLNAKWKDDAGNQSVIASADAPLSGPLTKDTLAPVAPAVNIVPDPITAANAAATLVNVSTAETNARLNLTLSSSAAPASSPLSQVKIATLPTIGFTFNSTSLTDCSESKVDLVGEVRPDCITASATATDKAGNVSLPGIDVEYKDSTAPIAPVVGIIPGNIQTDVNTVVELETTGETYTAVAHTLSDQDPGTSHLSAAANTEDLGYVALYIDTKSLTDGIVTATSRLTDGVGNVSLPGIATATKGLTTGSVIVTSPAANSLNTSMPSTSIAGTTTPGGKVDVFEVSTAGDEAILRNLQANAVTGVWSGGYRFLTSGTKTIYARKVGDTIGSTVRTFFVDALPPTVDSTALDLAAFLPGETIVIEGSARDDYSGVAAVEIEVYDISVNPAVNPSDPATSTVRIGKAVISDRAATCALCSTSVVRKNVLWKYDLTGALRKGVYTLHATSIDRALNRSAQPRVVNFIVL